MDFIFFPELAIIGFYPLDSILFLVLFLPFLAVAIRRLHDVGRSGWWVLIPLTIIGIIPYFYWMIKKGDYGENEYGEDPIRFG